MSEKTVEEATKVVEKTIEKVKDDPAALVMLVLLVGGVIYLAMSSSKQSQTLKKVEAVADKFAEQLPKPEPVQEKVKEPVQKPAKPQSKETQIVD